MLAAPGASLLEIADVLGRKTLAMLFALGRRAQSEGHRKDDRGDGAIGAKQHMLIDACNPSHGNNAETCPVSAPDRATEPAERDWD